MKCIAIDDEPMALAIITQFCQRIGKIELTTYTNPEVGLNEIIRTHPDIALLDIEMGSANGIDLAKKIPEGTFLIFTTAYSQYAVDGFDLNAVDYLCKPYSFARFEKAIQKAIHLKQLTEMNVQQTSADSQESITVKVEYKNVNVPLSDIVYIESINNYVRIILNEGRPLLTQISMKNMLEMLPTDRFVRIHKSYVVPKQRIASYTRTQVKLYYQNITLPVGRTYIDDFYHAMNAKTDE